MSVILQVYVCVSGGLMRFPDFRHSPEKSVRHAKALISLAAANIRRSHLPLAAEVTPGLRRHPFVCACYTYTCVCVCVGELLINSGATGYPTIKLVRTFFWKIRLSEVLSEGPKRKWFEGAPEGNT